MVLFLREKFNIVSHFVTESFYLTKHSPFENATHLRFTTDTSSLKNKVFGSFCKKNSLTLSAYREFFLGQFKLI